MALADRVTKPPRTNFGSPCSVGVLIDTLDGAELDAFREMLGTPERRGWPATSIYDALTAEGHTVALQSINRHRGNRCRCAADQDAA